MNIILNKILSKKILFSFLIIFFYKICILSATPLWANSSRSNQSTFWYQQTVPLPDNNKNSVNNAMQQALTNIFTKVTGKKDIYSISSIKDAINKPTDYIKNHSFTKGDYLNAESQFLVVNFDKEAIQLKLKNSGINTIWDEFSPSVLVVLCLVDKDKQYILQKDDELAKQITRESSAVGVKTIYPIMDIEDLNTINIHDLKAVITDNLGLTTKRYGKPTILAGFIEKSSYDTYHGRLTFLDAENKYSLRLPLSQTLHEVTEAISTLLASNLLPKYFKNLSAEKSTFNIKITNVSAVKNIKEINNYFMSSKILADAYPEEIKSNEVIFHVSTDSSIASLKLLFSKDYQFNEMFKFSSENNSTAKSNLINLEFIK